jgi:hypothetical protein
LKETGISAQNLFVRGTMGYARSKDLCGGSRGALIGATTGGVAGAAGGYFAALQSREQNQAPCAQPEA